MKLTPGQIVLRGQLEMNYGETGMEDRAEYLLQDHLLVRQLVGRDQNFELNIRTGDLVYILDENGRVLHFGTHAEERRPEGDYPANQPRLLSTDEGAELDGVRLMELYLERAPAVVVSTPHPKRLEYLNEAVGQKLDEFIEHQKDPTRFVSLGSSLVHERKLFEEVIEGAPRATSEGHLFIEQDDGRPRRITGRFVLHAIDKQGRALGLIGKRHWPLHVRDLPPFVDGRIWRLVMVRPIEDGRYSDNGFTGR